MGYIKQSVPRADGIAPGAGILPQDQIILYDVDDILSFPSPNDKGVKIEENIVLKPGRYAIGIYSTPGTIELTSGAEGDTDAVGFKPLIKFRHPGNELVLREFKANYINRKIVAVVRYCSGKLDDLIGSPCNPCKLTPAYTGNQEGNSNEFTVEQISKGNDIMVYAGNHTFEQPVSTVNASATSVEYAGDGLYQLSSGAANIEAISGGTPGSQVTLVGTSGTAPVVKAGESILLASGSDFTAAANSQLSLRAFNAGSGNIVWVETSRFPA